MHQTISKRGKKSKFIIITGGVLSGLGKGVVSASVGRLFSSDYKTISIKCDGYLNVDPGTMNPTEHGEVFVLNDGGEVDLDFGHYERFMNIDCQNSWSLTSGKMLLSLMEKERRGDFLGKTVQIVPHLTGEIRHTLENIAAKEKADIVLVEIGGTVGDMENLWFIEACRELVNDIGKDNVLFIHLGLLPVIDSQGQQKTKPLQQSINLLRERGIFPEVIVGRSKERISEDARHKLAMRCNVSDQAVLSDPDCESVYELPIIFEEEGLHEIVKKKFGFRKHDDLKSWKKLLVNQKNPKEDINIAICGKYTDLADSYISISEALIHCGMYQKTKVNVKWIDTTKIKNQSDAARALKGMNGMIVPGGFGSRGIEGKIQAVQYSRENGIPFLGICYGLQLAVIEYARNVCGLKNANTTEIDADTEHPVVDILPDQKDITQKGGTMRLGAYPAILKKGCKLAKLYDSLDVSERHRHRYEVNPDYHSKLSGGDLVFAGMSPDGTLVEFIENKKHPYFVATQAHPELKSRMDNPAPMFMGLVEAGRKHKKK